MGASVAASGGEGTRRGRRRAHRARAMSEINITPMVDVMLVLLIIFMVAAPLLSVGIPVDLPKTDAPPLEAPPEPPLVVTLTGDGEIAIMETKVEPAEFLPKLEAIAAERSDKKVFLRADGSVPYEELARIMGQLSAAGYTELGLVTDIATPSSGGAAASDG